MSARAYALSDGNSFYCSCERVFDARLARVPVIVLSNNDGCAIARTAEAKALGIRMGEPYFKIRQMCRAQGVRVYSSNYALYGNMSARVNTVYRRFSPRIEIYSIDESFLDLSDVREADRVTLCRDMRETVRAWTGIPTFAGIGPTKTLANHVAKKVPELGGVCDLTDPVQYEHWMVRIPPEDIWGVGPANARKLEALGCESVADVRDLDTRAVRKAMTVVGERLVMELRGMACLDLEEVAPTRKGCAVTRSFSDRVEDLATMEQAVATHATRLGEKLRAGGLGTDHVTVFFHTSEHDRDRPQRSVSSVVTLPEASNDTLVLVKACMHGVRKTWRDGYRYSKAGVVPFFIGCAIVPFLFYIRRSLEETEEFLKRKHRPSMKEVFGSLASNWKIVLLGMLLVGMTTISFYTITVYTPTFGKAVLKLSDTDSLLVTFCTALSNLFWLPVMGALSDRIGRKPLLLVFSALTLLTAYPVLGWLVASPSFGHMLIALLWLSFLYGSYNGAMVVALTEVIPASVRTAGFSLAYSLATALLGGFTPLVSTWLIEATGNRAAPGLWMAFGGACGLVATLLIYRRATQPVALGAAA